MLATAGGTPLMSEVIRYVNVCMYVGRCMVYGFDLAWVMSVGVGVGEASKLNNAAR